MAWESVLGTITGLNGSTCGLADPSKFPAQTPIGYSVTTDYTRFNIPNAEALAGIEFGEPMMYGDMGSVQLTDGEAHCNSSNATMSLSYNQPPFSGYLTTCSPNSSWWDWDKVYIICGVDVEQQLGRVGILVAPRIDPPQSGWAEWYLAWSSVSDKAFNWINNNVIPNVQSITSNGGGATHIAKRTGQLKDLSSNLSDILIVSGGGGGGLLVGETEYPGADAGGISGSGDNSADQTTGNAFGLGENGSNVSGGGSGLYGGYKGTSSKSGGAGSGYIGNSLLSNKKMVGYNVPTSSAESTKTESVNEASETPVANKPKIGNGFARIKFVREWIPPEPPNGFKIYNLNDEIGVKRDWNSMKVTTVQDVVQIVQNADRGNIIVFLDMGWTWSGLNIEPKDWSGDSIYLYDKNYDHDASSSACYIGILNYGTSNSMFMLNSDGTALATSEMRAHNWSSKQTPQGYCYASYNDSSLTCDYEGGIYIPNSINVYLNDQLYRPANN